MSKRRRRSASAQGCLLILLVLLCLVGFVGAAGMLLVPDLAAQQFGAPSPDLSITQRYLGAAQLLLNKSDLLEPRDPAGNPETFSIRLGETANSVAARLEENGLLRSGESFRTYLVYSGLDKQIQAGDYTLSAAMTPIEIAQQLLDATPQEVEFNILPGWRAEEIAAALPTSGLKISPDEFLKSVYSTHPQGWQGNGSQEGYLLPGPYKFNRNANADELVDAFLNQFNQQVTDELRQQYSSRGLNLQQAVILASIVQREAVLKDEQPMIASVFYNRLNANMKLDSDPTVQYALGYNQDHQTWWTNPLSVDDLKINSPYNTYQNPGLPPGPISNPSLSSLRAVAYPAESPYFYFRAACDGSGRHSFARTYQEQLNNACP